MGCPEGSKNGCESKRKKDCLRDLGVRVSTDLTFTAQIDMTVQAGSRMSGWALRTFRRRGRQLMLTILRSLIQPRLDYCRQLWSPKETSSINQLEDVQRDFISYIRDSNLHGKRCPCQVEAG